MWALSRPEATHRRTESSLTPRKRAASEIRRSVIQDTLGDATADQNLGLIRTCTVHQPIGGRAARRD
ncbi:hypothetical protein ACFFX0_11290 [Citricoccus parietis]|uniref:Uncharacterized protein n=1 Tax=Citricoccus parietis TaxID=592307 RepID=A0ABV5FYK9_9MICC